MAVTVFFGLRFWGVLAWPVNASAQSVLPAAPYLVGMTQIEFVDPAEGGQPLDFMLIYPAAPDKGAIPFKLFMAANLHLFKDAPIVADQLKHPLVMFSHGAGGNGSSHAGFGEHLASHGYSSPCFITTEQILMIQPHCTCATGFGSGRALY